jgi:O-methyltransferase involved in polyketide biosynthesis
MQEARLGAVEETLYIPLIARARETRKKQAVLRDPKAVEMVASIDFDAAKYGGVTGGSSTAVRTAIFDFLVRQFLAQAGAAGTVVELGTGLNTRFERVDNGTVNWIDLDLPDAIELRQRFFADTGRRRMLAASVADEGWLEPVAQSQGPYLFVAEGVLLYLPEDQVEQTLVRIAGRFPGAFFVLDTYPRKTLEWLRRMTEKRNVPARFGWACEDPGDLRRLGLRAVESATMTRPPAALLAQWPAKYRYLLPVLDPVLSRVLPAIGRTLTITLFQAGP